MDLVWNVDSFCVFVPLNTSLDETFHEDFCQIHVEEARCYRKFVNENIVSRECISLNMLWNLQKWFQRQSLISTQKEKKDSIFRPQWQKFQMCQVLFSPYLRVVMMLFACWNVAWLKLDAMQLHIQWPFMFPRNRIRNEQRRNGRDRGQVQRQTLWLGVSFPWYLSQKQKAVSSCSFPNSVKNLSQRNVAKANFKIVSLIKHWIFHTGELHKPLGTFIWNGRSNRNVAADKMCAILSTHTFWAKQSVFNHGHPAIFSKYIQVRWLLGSVLFEWMVNFKVSDVRNLFESVFCLLAQKRYQSMRCVEYSLSIQPNRTLTFLRS